MASLSLRGVGKIYAGGVIGAKDVNLEIEDKEFLILVGPSGCGKSTTLRMIAGLEEISEGELYIDDKIVNDVAPKDRDIAMVFQNYALYPHMSVFDNMAFGLKLRKVPKAIIKEKVHEAAKILDIEHLLERKPKALSGGQRQRVALGRAIVREPKVFLMDEPLSNLDAKLRVQMRAEIGKLHKRLGTTVIYVTHDQTEAMTMGTRIAVMKDGYLQQCASPTELYDEPVNVFVAGFIGSPQMNFINVTLEKSANGAAILKGDGFEITLNEGKANKQALNDYFGKEVIMGVRPECIYEDEAHMSTMAGSIVSADVELTEMMGAETYLYLKIGSAPVISRINRRSTAKAGDSIKVAIDTNKIHLFDKETELAIIH